jgi:hypothetical protein
VAWLVLTYRLPASSALKAAIRRKLTAIGAVYLVNAIAVLPASPAAERALRQTRNTIAGAGVPVVARGRRAGAETKIVRNVDRWRDRRQTSAVGTQRESARPTCHPIIWRQSDDALTGDHRLPNRRSSRLMASAQYRCDGADQGLTRSAAPGP